MTDHASALTTSPWHLRTSELGRDTAQNRVVGQASPAARKQRKDEYEWPQFNAGFTRRPALAKLRHRYAMLSPSSLEQVYRDAGQRRKIERSGRLPLSGTDSSVGDGVGGVEEERKAATNIDGLGEVQHSLADNPEWGSRDPRIAKAEHGFQYVASRKGVCRMPKLLAVAFRDLRTLLAFALLSSPAVGAVITFDDQPCCGEPGTPPASLILNGYAGLNWNNVGVTIPAGTGPNNGWLASLVSGPKVAYNGNGNPMGLASTDGAKFRFVSAYITSPYRDGMSIDIVGISHGAVVYEVTITPSATAATFYKFNWTGIDTVTFSASGGTLHQGYMDPFNETTFAVDNLLVTSSSTPTNLQATQFSTDGRQVALTWNYGSDPVDGFIIQYSLPEFGTGNWISLTTVSAASACNPSLDPTFTWFCSYIDTTVPAFSTTSYQASAYKGSTANVSPFSSPATAYQLKKCVLPWTGFSTGTGRSDCVNAATTKAPGTWIQVDYTPDSGLSSIHAAAQALPADPSRPRFDHFNWLQYIEHWPQCYLDSPQLHTATVVNGVPTQGTAVTTIGQVDPPIGGYYEYWILQQQGLDYALGDALSFYYNEQQQWSLNNGVSLGPLTASSSIFGFGAGGDQSQVETASLYDQPGIPCLSATPTDYLGFLTFLVGVSSPVGVAPPTYTVLNGFAWNTTYDKSATGGITVSTPKPPTTGGEGGVFNVTDIDVQDLPPSVQQQLIRDGAQGISTLGYVDRNSPMTAAFLSGPLGATGWYTGPVAVTLLATDIDGPTDVAATSYRVDGGLTLEYSMPFTVSGVGTHIIEFGSLDQAGNMETPRRSQSFTIELITKCDLNQDGVTTATDMQRIINQALGVATAANDLNGDGVVNIADVQIVTNAALNLGCKTN